MWKMDAQLVHVILQPYQKWSKETTSLFLGCQSKASNPHRHTALFSKPKKHRKKNLKKALE